MILVEHFKKGINSSLKEMKENITKQVEVLKEEAQKSHKESQENTAKQVMELNKTTPYLKREVETMKKTQREKTLEIETQGKYQETQMRVSAKEYKRRKKESRVQKIPQRTWTQQSKKMQNAKCS